MALQLVTPPTAEPMDLAAVKAHLYVDTTDDDAMIATLISAARDYAEGITAKQLVAARWKQVFDGFCYPFLKLQIAPVLRVVSIQYIDMQGVTQTVDPATYTIDYSTEPVRISPVFGQIWPIAVPQIGAVWVNLDAGYAAPITADTTAGTIAAPAWKPLAVGDVLRLSNSGGALPTPLKPKTDYFVQSVTAPGVYTLSTTVGGAAMALTDTGSGTSYVGEIPHGITTWMKIRLATIFGNREEMAMGRFGELVYVDRLLDGFRVTEF